MLGLGRGLPGFLGFGEEGLQRPPVSKRGSSGIFRCTRGGSSQGGLGGLQSTKAGGLWGSSSKNSGGLQGLREGGLKWFRCVHPADTMGHIELCADRAGPA